METNPFENVNMMNYSEYLRGVFMEKKSGDTFFVNTFGKKLANIRANLKFVTDQKIATKKGEEGRLWIKII